MKRAAFFILSVVLASHIFSHARAASPTAPSGLSPTGELSGPGIGRVQRRPAIAGPVLAPDRLSSLIQHAHELKLDERPEWIRLLHYHKTWRRSWASQAGGTLFFLDQNGATNPKSELDATLTSFFTPYKIADDLSEQVPRCALPARLYWLESELHFTDAQLPKASCHRFQEFQKKFESKSATLVFSSYYLNNPSSTFGHTLLRLNRYPFPPQNPNVPVDTAHHPETFPVDTQESEARGRQLLDYGINYSAVATTSNPVLFAFDGMFGIFQGAFTAMPYYYKVREYNDSESRDLWEYDLNLTQSELDQIVRHAWELGSAYFDYYYLTQNCSYHIFTLIEAAAPRLHLVDRLAYYVIPSDTVKVAVQTPDFVRAIHYRPSVRSVFNQRAADLSGAEQKQILALMDHPVSEVLKDSPLQSESRMHVLDAAADLVDYKFYRQLSDKEPRANDKKYELLLARSQIPRYEAVNIAPPLQEAPHTGHPSTRVVLAPGNQSVDGHFIDFGVRFALHDLLDPAQGYPHAASIEFLKITGRWNSDKGNLSLNAFSLIDDVSLSPMTTFSHQFSWRAGVLGYENWDGRCQECFANTAHMGGGPSVALFGNPNFIAFAFLDGEVAISSGFTDTPYRVGAGPSAGLRLKLLPTLISLTEYRYRRYWLGPTTDDQIWSSSLRWDFVDRWALDFSGSLSPYLQTGELSTFYYF